MRAVALSITLVYRLNQTLTYVSLCNAPLSDIPMFYIKYLTMYKEHMQAVTIRVIVWLCVCTGDNPLAKASGLSSCTYAKPYNNSTHIVDSFCFWRFCFVPDYSTYSRAQLNFIFSLTSLITYISLDDVRLYAPCNAQI